MEERRGDEKRRWKNQGNIRSRHIDLISDNNTGNDPRVSTITIKIKNQTLARLSKLYSVLCTPYYSSESILDGLR